MECRERIGGAKQTAIDEVDKALLNGPEVSVRDQLLLASMRKQGACVRQMEGIDVFSSQIQAIRSRDELAIPTPR